MKGIWGVGSGERIALLVKEKTKREDIGIGTADRHAPPPTPPNSLVREESVEAGSKKNFFYESDNFIRDIETSETSRSFETSRLD